MTQMMPDALESRTISIPGDGRRLDVALSEAAGLTRSRVAALMADGNVTVDGKVETKSGAKAKSGQTVILMIPAPKPAVPVAQEIPLTILYQDDDLAVVLKPCGMVVHPAAGNEDGTLVNALLHHLDHLSGIGGELRPGIVHRLDKDTSGLLLVAKNDQSQLALSRQLQERQMEKHYRALVEGNLREDSGRIDQPIARSKKDRKKMAIDPEGRPSITDWTVLARGRNVTLLDVHILTGRTHQIRVHMKSIGHPVCGDPIYGSGRGAKVPRLMLHAYTLSFTHPRTGERMTSPRRCRRSSCRGCGGTGWNGRNNVSSRKAENVTSCGDTISIMRMRQNGKSRTDGTDEFGNSTTVQLHRKAPCSGDVPEQGAVFDSSRKSGERNTISK